MSPKIKTSIAIHPDLQSQLDMRDDNLSGSIAKCLSRYFGLLARSRRELAAQLSEAELSLILDALNGTGFMDEHSAGFIPHEIADSIRLNETDEKWGVDGDALLKKLGALDHTDLTALADAAERWWRRVGNGENPETGGALK